ncbi:MAG: hypothetical protein ACOVNY_01460 [Chitinophagaceae bacterium]
MKKLTTILFFLLLYVSGFAQDFFIEYPKKADDFTDNFLRVVNDAPLRFVHVKGKPTNKQDSIHKGSNTFESKIKLPNSLANRVVVDSTLYVEYFFGDYIDLENAEASFTNLSDKIMKAFSKRVFSKEFPVDSGGSVIKYTKIAYCKNRGFFHFNVSLQIIQLPLSRKYRVLLQVYSGKPQFYYRVMRNEPVASFILVNNLKNNIASLQNNSYGCPTEIVPFECIGKKISNDSIFLIYQKEGFLDYPNAMSEFDVYMTNIRSSLGTEYVYSYLPVKSPFNKKIAYIHMNDLENPNRKTIFLQLVEKPKNSLLPQNQRKEYVIELVFVQKDLP